MHPQQLHSSPFYTCAMRTGMVAASHHVTLCDKLNGYCLNFYTAPKDFS